MLGVQNAGSYNGDSPEPRAGGEIILRRGCAKKHLDFAAAIQQASNAQIDPQRSLPSDVGDSPSSIQLIPSMPMYPPIFPRQSVQLPGSDLAFPEANDSERPTLRAPSIDSMHVGAIFESQILGESASGPGSSIDRNLRRKRKIRDLATAIYEASASDPAFEPELSSLVIADNALDPLMLDPLLRAVDENAVARSMDRAHDEYGSHLQNTGIDGNEGLYPTGDPASGEGGLEALLADIAQFLPQYDIPGMALDQINQPDAQPAQPLPSNLVSAIQEDQDASDLIGPFAKPTKGVHLLVHVCPECGKAFDRPSNLERHTRTHSGEAPFKCDEPDCGKAFKQVSSAFPTMPLTHPITDFHVSRLSYQRSALTIHRRRHSNERPFACEFPDCDMRFSESSGLARHRRAHTGRRPWRCERPDCTMSFTRQTGLALHMKTHETKHAATPTQTAQPGSNPKPPVIKKRRPKKKPEVKTAAEIAAEEAIVEEGYQRYVHATLLAMLYSC